ncbi:S8 family serine peptidase [Bacillus massiliigorillae]|uniref:S8 family serine peptidase n=1 Tax=Bacillus massiliigorillae TaxID=1243664 RepID=UPI00039EF31D|nr:S8 family serine peptidase [Bacillus massiliigorillae]
MKKLSILLALMLAISPITGYAAPETNNQANEQPSQEQSNTVENIENSNQPNAAVQPPVSKKQVKQIFSEAEEYEPGELVISFASTASEEKKQEILKQYDLTVESTLLNGNYILASTPRGDSIQEIAKELVQYKEIAYVQPNTKVKKSFVSQEPYYYKQWYLPKIEAPKAWDVTKGSSDVVVAVVDGGAQKDHPDLKNSIVSPIDMVTGSSDYIADNHGTHVAGIIAAAFNKYGTAGIAPNTKIMPINVFDGEYAETFTIAAAIEYAVKNGADIINLSFGDYAYDYVEDNIIQYAVKNGVVVIAAAGNEDTDLEFYPAAYANVIAVSATDRYDNVTYFSNYGKYVDVSAPGEGIMSTIAGSRYAVMDGTSMAAPVVSGIAALILAKNPFTTVGEVQTILKKSSVDYGNRGWDMFYGSGRVSAYKALTLTGSPISNFKSPSSFTITGKNRISVSFTAPKNTNLSVQIQNANGKVVKTLLSNKAWNGGQATVYWNGSLDNGSYATNGQYKFVVSFTSNKGNFRTYKTIPVKNTMPATVSAPAVTYYSPVAQSKLSLPINVSKPAKLTAQVVNAQNKLVKSIWSNASVSAGSRTFTWDGKNGNGKYMVDGTYKVIFTAVDANKAKSTTSASIVVDREAPALSVAAEPAVFVADGTNTSIARFNVREPAYVTVKVVSNQGENVRTLANNQLFSPSTYSLKWDGKNSSNVDVAVGNYQYVVECKDRAGNITTKATSFFALQR